MKKIVLQKENGEIKVFDDTSLFDSINNSNSEHKCAAECVNASVLKCPKIADEKKQTIDKYEFITEGFQIINENGKMDRFRVLECNNYEKSQKTLSKERRLYLKELRKNMAMLYYGTGSVEEADEIQRQQIEKGLQKKPKTR